MSRLTRWSSSIPGVLWVTLVLLSLLLLSVGVRSEVIDCSGNTCTEMTVECSESPCVVTCDGFHACQRTDFVCPYNNTGCDIHCNSALSCMHTNLYCVDGVCEQHCGALGCIGSNVVHDPLAFKYLHCNGEWACLYAGDFELTRQCEVEDNCFFLLDDAATATSLGESTGQNDALKARLSVISNVNLFTTVDNFAFTEYGFSVLWLDTETIPEDLSVTGRFARDLQSTIDAYFNTNEFRDFDYVERTSPYTIFLGYDTSTVFKKFSNKVLSSLGATYISLEQVAFTPGGIDLTFKLFPDLLPPGTPISFVFGAIPGYVKTIFPDITGIPSDFVSFTGATPNVEEDDYVLQTQSYEIPDSQNTDGCEPPRPFLGGVCIDHSWVGVCPPGGSCDIVLPEKIISSTPSVYQGSYTVKQNVFGVEGSNLTVSGSFSVTSHSVFGVGNSSLVVGEGLVAGGDTSLVLTTSTVELGSFEMQTNSSLVIDTHTNIHITSCNYDLQGDIVVEGATLSDFENGGITLFTVPAECENFTIGAIRIANFTEEEQAELSFEYSNGLMNVFSLSGIVPSTQTIGSEGGDSSAEPLSGGLIAFLVIMAVIVTALIVLGVVGSKIDSVGAVIFPWRARVRGVRLESEARPNHTMSEVRSTGREDEYVNSGGAG